MKETFSAVAFIVLGFIIGTMVVNKIYKYDVKLPESIKFIAPYQVNYDSACIVGNKYTIYGDFEKHEVVIIGKNNGNVKYTYPQYVGSTDNFGFVRTCKEFIEKTHPR